MMDYYKEVKETGLKELGSIMHEKIVDDEMAVCSAVAAILKNGTCLEAAKALGAMSDWKWGTHELAGHSAKA